MKRVTLQDGKIIEYVTDEKNRRIVRKVNGVITSKWVYEGLLRPVAEYDGQNNLVARYVYGTGINVPEYMVKNGETFRIITDHLGSVRMVVNATTGAIAQQIDYDEYGIVLSDNNPGFVPFGYAGGLYDQETGLVRFWMRDYNPKAGRWTSKDPMGLDDGTNVYTYVGNDPVTFIDPTGEFAQILFGGLTGAAFEALLQLLIQQIDPCHEFDWSAVGDAALIGAATGGIGEIINALKAYKAANKVQKATKNLNKQIKEHEEKLKKYIKDPDANDNKDFLKNAPNQEVRDKIIAGRVKHLKGEIETFKESIKKIKKGDL